MAQWVASLPYVLVCALVFEAFIHFIPGINTSAESYVYVVVMSWVMQLVMEGVDWILIEVLQNDLLAVTGGMVMIGFTRVMSPIETT